jgi:hypothetical protein
MAIGRPTELPLDVLRLDPQNPRLPEDLDGADQETLRRFIIDNYEPLTVGRSIALHGYFGSEPLIVVAEDDGLFTVVEGNRRLVALQLATDPELAASSGEEAEWRALSEAAELPEVIPVIVADDRQSVAPIIGYRHISGVEPWEPFAKARFIANLVGQQSMTFEAVAEVVGESLTDVRSLYRNHAILEQGREDLGIDTSRAESQFGVFTAAMGSRDLRAFVGAPNPGDVRSDEVPIPEDHAEQLAEALSWLFGDADGRQKVISESRDIRVLASVVQSEDGLEVLRETRDLEAAEAAIGGARNRLLRRLVYARGALRAARADVDEFRDDGEVAAAIRECYEAASDLTDHGS